MKTNLSISIQEEESEKIRKCAVLENKTISEYIRSILREKCGSNKE